MSMIGATLEDLDSLSTRLQTTSGDVGSVKDQAVHLTSNVVGNVTEAARLALSEIATQMDLMSQSVSAASSQAQSANWTGANAVKFLEGASNFQAAVNAAGANTHATFENFLVTANTMSAALEVYVNQLSASLLNAQDSAAQMSSAVTGQRNNLDAVMNQGIAAA